MRQIPDHPEIRHAERTGYPSWVRDEYDGFGCCRCGRRLSEYDNFVVLDWSQDKVLCEDCACEDDEEVDE